MAPRVGTGKCWIIRAVSLHRTPVTVAIYTVNGAWASFIYLSGPVAPIVAEDLGVPITAAGLVGTALAAGIVTAGALGPASVRRWGRYGATRIALIGLVGTLTALTVLPGVLTGAAGFGLVLALTWISAAFGGTALNASMARLADAHPEHSATVITESNAVAAWVGLFSPLLLGTALGAGLGWWIGIAFCLAAVVVALAAILVADRLEPASRHAPADTEADLVDDVATASAAGLPEPLVEHPAHPPRPPQRHRMPPAFRIALVALFAAVASEFSINYWGSTLIREQTGAATSTATSAMTAAVLGVAVGRTVGPRITARLGRHRTLLAGFTLALVGFFLLWSAQTLPLSVAGLFVLGLGLSSLFPLLLDRGILLSDGQPDLAMGRASLVLGVAVGAAPFALGALGSVVDVRTALLLVPLVILVGLVGVVRSRPPAEPAAHRSPAR